MLMHFALLVGENIE